MTTLIFLALAGMYNPQDWQNYPSMTDVRCITSSPTNLYVAVPGGVYVLDRYDYHYVRCLTRADGIVDEVNLCAWNPARSDLFITTPGRLYEYLPATGLFSQLAPPFKEVRSIGIAPDGAYFDTENGLYGRRRTVDEYFPARSLPSKVTWYGRRDTSNPQDYVFLTPYFVTDEQLANYSMTLVRRDVLNRKLFVATDGYGVLVYNAHSGLKEDHIRLGPGIASVRRIIRLDNRLWFVGLDRTDALDSAGDWNYYLTRPGDISLTGFRLLLPTIANLNRNERLSALLPDSGELLLGTDRAIYVLGKNSRLTTLVKLEYRANALLKLRDSLLVGTDNGLFMLEGDSLSELVDPYGRTDWGVYDIVRSSAGQTFFGTLGGVVELAPGDSWHRYVPPGFDLSQPVRTLAAGGDYLFMGSASGIIVLNTKDGSYTTIDSTYGLPTTDIAGLYADDHYLWIASPDMVSRFDYTKTLR
jgi:hypothetical protein